MCVCVCVCVCVCMCVCRHALCVIISVAKDLISIHSFTSSPSQDMMAVSIFYPILFKMLQSRGASPSVAGLIGTSPSVCVIFLYCY